MEVCLEVSLSWWQDFPLFSLKAWHTSRLIYLSCSPKTSFPDIDLKQDKWKVLVWWEFKSSADDLQSPECLGCTPYWGPLLWPSATPSDIFLYLPFPPNLKMPVPLGLFHNAQWRKQKWKFRNTIWSKWNCLPLNKQRWFDRAMLYGMSRSWSTWCGTSFIILTLSIKSDLTNY